MTAKFRTTLLKLFSAILGHSVFLQAGGGRGGGDKKVHFLENVTFQNQPMSGSLLWKSSVRQTLVLGPAVFRARRKTLAVVWSSSQRLSCFFEASSYLVALNVVICHQLYFTTIGYSLGYTAPSYSENLFPLPTSFESCCY